VLTEWSINKNVRFIFLDITPPNDHMIGELRSKVSDQAPPIHGHLFCVPSYAHILSLLVQDGFSEIRSVLYKIKRMYRVRQRKLTYKAEVPGGN
jgi:hypothetical protein